jgi:very-short-patch-repair endonuclease
MLLEQKIEVGAGGRFTAYYENLGYDVPRYFNKDYGKYFVKKGTKILVNIEDLLPTSRARVKIKCDYCEKVYTKNYLDYITWKDKEKVHGIYKDACSPCRGLKQIEIFQTKYGVSNPNKLKSVRNKIDATNLKKYGCINVMGNNEVKERLCNTNIKRYGNKMALNNDAVKQKAIRTLQKNTGEKIVNPFESKKLKNKIVANGLKARSERGETPTSKQQNYLNVLLQGKLNYPEGNTMLDIAFPNKKIYIEYDGGGHDFAVKVGQTTKESFNKRQRKRDYYLMSLGWKRIRIKSSKDWLPSDDKIKSILDVARAQFDSGRSWFEVDIDKGIVRTSKIKRKYEFGELRKIFKSQVIA